MRSPGGQVLSESLHRGFLGYWGIAGVPQGSAGPGGGQPHAGIVSALVAKISLHDSLSGRYFRHPFAMKAHPREKVPFCKDFVWFIGLGNCSQNSVPGTEPRAGAGCKSGRQFVAAMGGFIRRSWGVNPAGSLWEWREFWRRENRHFV